MTLTISPPLIQQLQPKFLEFRNLFQSRENNSKIYSWPKSTRGSPSPPPLSSSKSHTPSSRGVSISAAWWFGAVGRDISGFASGFTYLCVLLFELFYVSFGQAIAAFAPNELLASLLVPIFFLFVVSFCGIVVPYVALPYFWRSWMYWLSPFHYLLEGFLAVAVHGKQVVCQTNEFAVFSPPSGMSCQAYARPQIEAMGGYVQTAANGDCQLCAYRTGDEFARSFNVYYSNIWRDFGIMIAFIIFNYGVVFVGTYLRFNGRNPLKGVFGGLKQKKVKSKLRKRRVMVRRRSWVEMLSF